MEYNETVIICKKNRLWKQQRIVQDIIVALTNKGYQFREVVLGEPRNFIFAETIDEVHDLFTKKGFYGIRIKLGNDDVELEINSNTDGVDNVQYTVYATTKEHLQKTISTLKELTEIIHPSNDQLASFLEWMDQHKQLRNTLIISGIVLYLLYLFFR